MRQVVCVCCEYETMVVEGEVRKCPHGCTVDGFQEKYDSSYTPPTTKKSTSLTGLFETQPIKLIDPGSSDAEVAESERREAQ